MDSLNNEKSYLFSIVIAVYNCGLYLDETITSVIGQNIGFEENVQLILVNDGSTDDSLEICKKYQELYPDNVIVVDKENGGVSSARNAGLPYATGKYINFLDSDDMFSTNVLLRVSDFFEKNEDKTDVVCIPKFFFDAAHGPYWQNTKFKLGCRVVSLIEHYDISLMSMASSFFHNRRKDDLYCDETLKVSEDFKVVNTVLLDKQTLGLCPNCAYYYRRRSAGEKSAIQSAKEKKNWYTENLQKVAFYFRDLCNEKFGYIPKFIQYALACDLQWRITQANNFDVLETQEEQDEYLDVLYEAIRLIDDDIIEKMPKILFEHKAFWLYKKYRENVQSFPGVEDLCVLRGSHYIASMSRGPVTIEFSRIEKNSLYLRGTVVVLPYLCKKEEVQVVFTVNDQEYTATDIFCDNDEKLLKRDVIWYRKHFEISLPLVQDLQTVKCYIKINGRLIRKPSVKYDKYSPITNTYKNAYYYKDGFVATCDSSSIVVGPCGRKGHLKKELKLQKELLTCKKEPTAKKGAFIRILYFLAYPFLHKKRIWIIADKADRADDNGEAFFKYLSAHKEKDIVTYFAINKKSANYKYLKPYGKILQYLSFKHKLLYLFAEAVISAHSHDDFFMPIWAKAPLRDLTNECKFVFLQHGIIKYDISRILNKSLKNFDLFIVSAKGEYDSILHYNYGYKPEEVLLSGLPRYDYLYDKQERIITINSTWRRYLFEYLDPKTNIWIMKDGFEESDYYKFYNELLNSQKLLSAAEQYGYKVQFLPHPILFPYVDKFHADPRVKILDYSTVYRDMYAQTSLMVTDYSSAIFDFAYLRKPCLYTQFEPEFIAFGRQDGYFDDARDGFGEVTDNVEDTVSLLIDYMKNDCALKDKYRKRIDDFFAFSDTNNCERIYNEILKITRK